VICERDELRKEVAWLQQEKRVIEASRDTALRELQEEMVTLRHQAGLVDGSAHSQEEQVLSLRAQLKQLQEEKAMLEAKIRQMVTLEPVDDGSGAQWAHVRTLQQLLEEERAGHDGTRVELRRVQEASEAKLAKESALRQEQESKACEAILKLDSMLSDVERELLQERAAREADRHELVLRKGKYAKLVERYERLLRRVGPDAIDVSSISLSEGQTCESGRDLSVFMSPCFVA